MKALLSALVLAALFSARPASADDAPEASAGEEEVSAAEERSTAFRAVTGPETEDVPGGALLIGAYLAIWALTLGYLFRLGRIARGIESDVADLRETLKRVDDDVR
jgi:CcmD family protein